MIKVLFLIHDLSVGGAEKVLVNLVNNMSTEKFDITVMTLFGGGVNEQFLSSNIRYISCFKNMIPGNSHFMKILSPSILHKCLIKEKYDIEVAYLEGPAARIISGCPDSNTKLVSWIHIEQKSKKNAARAFRSYNESVNCYQKFDRIVCVSETVKKDFYSLYPTINKLIEVFYNTNESEKIKKQSTAVVDKNIFCKDELKLIGIGKIVANKGFDRLARILKRLRETGYPVHCYVLGIGPEQEKIEKYLRENKLQNYFSFLGYHTNPYKYIANCDLFVCSSFAEGFSTATTEALIVGIPVCTVEVSGMREMLGDNEYGIITDNKDEALYDAIERLLSDPQLLKYYKEKAIERGKMFSTDITVKKVEDLFESLVE